MHETYQGFRITYQLEERSGVALVGGTDRDDAKATLEAELQRQFGDDLPALGFNIQTCVADSKIKTVGRGVTMNHLDDF